MTDVSGPRGMPKEAKEARAKKVKHVVILGGGIVGASVAYYLRQEHDDKQKKLSAALPFDLEITIVESAATTRRCACGKVECGYGSLHALGVNSGSSSGFLEKDACDGTPMEALARHGFDAHVALAQHLERNAEDRVDFRRLQHVVHSGTVGRTFASERPVYEHASPKPWTSVDEHGPVMTGSNFCKSCSAVLAAKPFDPEAFRKAVPCAQTDRGTACDAPIPAQLHPRKLCWALAKRSGAVIVSGTEAVGVMTKGSMPNTEVTSVRVRPSGVRTNPEPEPELSLEPEPEQQSRATEQTLPQLSAGQSIWPPTGGQQARSHADRIRSALPSGQLSCTDVVVALGPWSAAAITEPWFEQQELELPLSAVVGQSLIARPKEELLVGISEGDEVKPQPVAITSTARELVLPPPLPIREPIFNATKVNLVHLADVGSLIPTILPRPAAEQVHEVWVGSTVEPMGSVMRHSRSRKPAMTLKPARQLADGVCYESAVVVGALRAVAVQVAPALAEAEHVSQSACVWSHTPDGLPVIGAVPHCGKLQPATSRLSTFRYNYLCRILQNKIVHQVSFTDHVCRVRSQCLRCDGSW